MRTRSSMTLGLVVLSVALAGCPVPRGLPGAGGGGGAIGTCDGIDASDAGRKLNAFLVATDQLNKGVVALANHTKTACVTMGTELGLPADQLEGDTGAVCHNVAEGLKANLQVGLKAEARLDVKYQPAVCTVDAQAAAEVSARCEGKAQADVSVTCEGRCGGTCNGACDGTCSATNASGECAGTCEGTCRGSCSGSCQGTADVQAEAQCEASAEIEASIKAECTPPEVEVAYDASLVVDASKVEAVQRAIQKGLPELLMVKAKMVGVQKAFVVWASTVKDLNGAAGELASSFGKQSMCVSRQIAAAFGAMANIQVQMEVSVSASVEVGGAAGASM